MRVSGIVPSHGTTWNIQTMKRGCPLITSYFRALSARSG
jgi:hypothetical protein